MEETAAAISSVGVILTAVLLWDAWTDRTTYKASGLNGLMDRITKDRLVTETVRFVVQALLLWTAFVFIRDPGIELDTPGILVSVTTLMAGSSVYVYLRKKKVVDG